jgi:hypothetical protein
MYGIIRMEAYVLLFMCKYCKLVIIANNSVTDTNIDPPKRLCIPKLIGENKKFVIKCNPGMTQK